MPGIVLNNVNILLKLLTDLWTNFEYSDSNSGNSSNERKSQFT